MTRINVLPALPGLVTYNPDFLERAAANALFTELLNDTPWQQETILMYGRELPVPRLNVLYGDADYTYSQRRHVALPFTPALLQLKQLAEAEANTRFNTVLLNLYRTGQDSVSWHADSETDLGPMPIIASISLGAEREFKLRLKAKVPDRKTATLKLAHGSCLIMGAGLQKDWEHAVLKTTKPTGPRINLTFRWIV